MICNKVVKVNEIASLPPSGLYFKSFQVMLSSVARNDDALLNKGVGRKAGKEILLMSQILNGLSAHSPNSDNTRHCEGGTTEAIPCSSGAICLGTTEAIPCSSGAIPNGTTEAILCSSGAIRNGTTEACPSSDCRILQLSLRDNYSHSLINIT
jgi:hypothetical protein